MDLYAYKCWFVHDCGGCIQLYLHSACMPHKISQQFNDSGIYVVCMHACRNDLKRQPCPLSARPSLIGALASCCSTVETSQTGTQFGLPNNGISLSLFA